MSQVLLAFLGSFVQAKGTKFYTNVGLDMLINLSSRFYYNHQKYMANFFYTFSNFALCNAQLAHAIMSIIFLGSFSNVATAFIALSPLTSSIMEVLPH